MLTVKRTDHGYYYIQLDGETIHGGLSKESSVVYLKSYQKIWDSGYKFAKDEEGMKRIIMYRYISWTEACGCCSNSESVYDVYEDGLSVSEGNWCELAENEADLRSILKHLEPFDVDPDSWWF